MKINHQVSEGNEGKDENKVLINPKIFKAYDIRGIYPEELDEEGAFVIGRAFVQFLGKNNPKIVVGQDNRLSSPSLAESLIKGLTSEGARVTDIGLATTPILYWASAFFKFDGGINVTASHNPSQYNGLKIVRERTLPVSGESGLKEIQKLAEGISGKEGKGELVSKEVIPEYLDFNLKIIDVKKVKPLRVVVDTANAVAGVVVKDFFKRLPCQASYLFSELDGSFPNHAPDPLVKENLKWLQTEIKKEKADLGIAFDGDGDRIIFVTEQGEAVSGDIITALLASLILKENPGAKILYDIRSSNVVKETIEEKGGRALASRIGHSFIKEKMREEDVLFAGELSGHYYHKDHFFCEAPFFVLLKVLEELSQSREPFSQIVKPFQKYFQSGEINLEVEDKEKVLRMLKKKFETGKVSKLDGLRVDFDDWWFLARPSNTEPVLRVSLEAKTEKLLRDKTNLLSDILHG